jgi:hypothetical protein
MRILKLITAARIDELWGLKLFNFFTQMAGSIRVFGVIKKVGHTDKHFAGSRLENAESLIKK